MLTVRGSHCAAEIMAIVTEECFDELDAAPERITGAEVGWVGALQLSACEP